MWGGYIWKLLADERPTLRDLSPRTWIKETDYRERDFQASFAAFTHQRAGLMPVLRALSPEQWARSGTLRRGGKVLERTVAFYAESLVQHELRHLDQFRRIVDRVRAGGR
jgi:hypothetical protein